MINQVNKIHQLSICFASFIQKTKQFSLIIAVILFLSPILLCADVYYLNGKEGQDENNGLSPQTAWKTINKANKTLIPGDTVYIIAGTYNQTINPQRSGKPGKPITYARYQKDKVIISDVTIGVDLRNKHYIIIDGLTICNTKYWVYMRFEPSTHNTIKNCHMEECTSGWAGIFMGGDVGREGHSHFNRILNNTLKGKCRPDNLIQCSSGATYNLFQGNKFIYGPHAAIELEGRSYPTHHNIIRNNVFHNYYHTAIIVYTNAHHTLVEGNIILDSGKKHLENDCGSEKDRLAARQYHRAIQLGASHNIIRHNVMINNGSFCLESKEDRSSLANHNRIYNNTFYKNYMALFSNCKGSVNDNVLKNNIFYMNRDYEIHELITDTPRNNYYISNNIMGSLIYYYPDGEVSHSYLQSEYPNLWKDNLSFNPMFQDEKERDLHLQPFSPLINAGVFLTQTTSQGSGTNIYVEDARYFMDGWGIIEGDTIQLEGDNRTALVVEVDYENNIIIVDRPLIWNLGQNISLAYHDYSPDIGAYEYENDDLFKELQRMFSTKKNP